MLSRSLRIAAMISRWRSSVAPESPKRELSALSRPARKGDAPPASSLKSGDRGPLLMTSMAAETRAARSSPRFAVSMSSPPATRRRPGLAAWAAARAWAWR